MAYCSKCGAYIPDGQTKCLACGFDPAASSGAQTAYAYEEEYFRSDAEAERSRKQEENRRWAQEEYARRQQEKEAQEKAARKKEEQDRIRAQQRAEAQERIRQRAESYNENKRSESGFTYTEGNSKVFATLSYISLGFMLQKMFLPDDEYAKFHSKQGERLFVCGLVAEIIGGIFGLAWIPILLRIGYTIRGISNASKGEETELPYINDLFKKK